MSEVRVEPGGVLRAGADAAGAQRVVGYDVARSLAILGMIVVHFCLVAAKDLERPRWMAVVFEFLDGRAAATFVVLAGVGITMMSRRAVASGDAVQIADVRRRLFRRGLFLLAIGFINLTIWQGDILRVYGVSLLLAARLLRASARTLLLLAVAFAAVFVLLMFVVDFDKNWDWKTLTYHDLWTPSGVIRNLFYDGFRSVFPWTGLMLYGMWLGRLNLTTARPAGRVLLIAVAATACAAAVSRLIVWWLTSRRNPHIDLETAKALFGTDSMPALPLFLITAVGTATALISACAWIVAAWSGWGWRPLAVTGQMALTWYFAHIVIGLGGLVALQIVNTKALPVAAGYGLLFFVAAVLLSLAWKSLFRQGPLEWVMRRVAG
jgi:uncharacterized protein